MYATDALRGGHVIMLGEEERNKEAARVALQAYPGGMQVSDGLRCRLFGIVVPCQ